jgi:hypothetical protein
MQKSLMEFSHPRHFLRDRDRIARRGRNGLGSAAGGQTRIGLRLAPFLALKMTKYDKRIPLTLAITNVIYT